ncbi:HAD-IA family hydrolase [Rhodococcus ruber]|uniref:HAD-IA family hydrolase n=1 Tax=Rhodococcus ruber TaxID=1830 RepID=A0ABT4MJ61_9NOCA|nr:HAD-IA family hydrolase [Rhodococcus ruber]MCZ4521016.1 HAD-IA family hydrolase [Rhodococcus ruber]
MSLQSSRIRRSVTATAFLFDMDGTLVDSHASIEAVWFEFAERHGVDKAVMAKALPGRLAADIILRVLGPTADLRAALRWIREREHQSPVPVRPIAGTKEFLASVPRDRWAVVTSASRSMMVRRLTAAGLPTPNVAVCAEDVAVGKPDPEGFLSAAQQLGVSIESCVVFEDADAGIAAAHAAGARCIAIGNESGPQVARVDDFESLRVAVHDGALVVDVEPVP